MDKSFFIQSAIGLGQCSRFTGVDSASLLTLAAETAGKLDELLLQADCIKGLGDIALARSDHDQARQLYERAQPLYEQVGSLIGQANCILLAGASCLWGAPARYDAAVAS